MDDIVWPPKKPQNPENSPNNDIAAAENKKQFRQSESRAVASFSAAESIPAEASIAIKPLKQDRFEWLKLKHAKLNKKQKILFWSLLVALIFVGVAGTFATYKHFHPPAPAAAVVVVKKKTAEPPKPTTEPSRLTGIEVSPDLNKRPVTGVMIENSPDARPQSGLKDAGIVYEAVAEGGITRFLALFQEAQPDYIGPVRSVRPYYLDFLMPYDAPVAHVGGAPQALADIKTFGVKDLDQFFNSSAYWRITQRYAPHNMYTSFAKLDALNASKGYTSSTFTGLPRKKDAPAATPTAKSINFAISSFLYGAHYDYDAASNSYKRSEGAKPHVDEKSGTQLSPKVVVALVMTRGTASDGQHTNYGDVGSGHMYVFQDGTLTEGTWSKADRKAQFVFTDSAGKPIKFNAGQTWISLVDSPAAVTYTP